MKNIPYPKQLLGKPIEWTDAPLPEHVRALDIDYHKIYTLDNEYIQSTYTVWLNRGIITLDDEMTS